MKTHEKDDRLNPIARIAFGFLAVLSIIYGPLLYLYPGGTAGYWAWDVQPEMSAVWLGAGYILAASFLLTILLLGRFQKLFVALLTVWSFSCAMLFATLIHIDRFFVDRLAFWVWFFIYLIVPIAVPTFWLLNKKHAIPHQEGELQFPKNSAYLGGLIILRFSSCCDIP